MENVNMLAAAEIDCDLETLIKEKKELETEVNEKRLRIYKIESAIREKYNTEKVIADLREKIGHFVVPFINEVYDLQLNTIDYFYKYWFINDIIVEENEGKFENNVYKYYSIRIVYDSYYYNENTKVYGQSKSFDVKKNCKFFCQDLSKGLKVMLITPLKKTDEDIRQEIKEWSEKFNDWLKSQL